MIDWAFKYTRTIFFTLIFIFIMGLSSYFSIPKESTPDVKIPILYVSLIHEGISPQDSQRLLIRPIEQEIRSLEGIKEIKANAYEGGGNVIIEFYAGFNVDKARQDVRDKIDKAKIKFPINTKEPLIEEVNLSQFPILLVKLSGEVPERTLFKLARDLKDKIETEISTILKAELVGDKEDSVEILINPIIYEQYPLFFEELYKKVNDNNQIIPAGRLEQEIGGFSLKVSGLIETPHEIATLPVLTHGEGIIKLEDIAEVRRAYKEPKSIARDRIKLGKSTQGVVLEISKRAGTNLIETVSNVRTLVEKEKQGWPPQVNVNYAQDESSRIHDMLNELQNSLILALILVMLVIVFSLGWRSSLLVGVAVPGAFLMGILILHSLSHTLNIVVLFSLIFSVGMLVDGAIIVVEFADRRMHEGLKPYDAYLEAAKKTTWPVITSISTILVVFLPLLFWPGVVGQFMKFMPITLLSVLTASILMALIFIPALASIFIKEKPVQEENIFLKALDKLTGWYVEKLNYCLEKPKKVIWFAVLLLIVVKTTHSFFGKGIEFFPDVEPDSIAIHVHARGNFSLEEKVSLVKKVEKELLPLKEFQSVYSRIGEQSKNAEPPADDVIGVITLELVDWKKRKKAKAIITHVEKILAPLPGIKTEVIKEKKGPSGGKPFHIQMSGVNRPLMEKELKRLQLFCETLNGLHSIENSLPIPGIEWRVHINKGEAFKLDTNITSIGHLIKLITNGSKLGSYRPNDVKEEVDILLRYKKDYRSLEQLKNLRIHSKNGLVPLSSFMKIIPNKRLSKIERVNGYEVLSLKADLLPGTLLVDKIQEFQEFLRKDPPPAGIKIEFKGEDEDRKEAGNFLLKAFGVAIAFVALILVTQFNSFFYVLVILSAVVMSTIGVFIGLLIHNLALGIVMGGIGIIALSGIIVSNNIIMLDTYKELLNSLEEKGTPPTLLDIKNIIVETCRQRFRPIILTKLTTILGLLPIMFRINIDFLNFDITYGAPSTEWWVLLSTCIVYGVLFASSLTLFVTPSILMVHAKRTRKIN